MHPKTTTEEAVLIIAAAIANLFQVPDRNITRQVMNSNVMPALLFLLLLLLCQGVPILDQSPIVLGSVRTQNKKMVPVKTRDICRQLCVCVPLVI